MGRGQDSERDEAAASVTDGPAADERKELIRFPAVVSVPASAFLSEEAATLGFFHLVQHLADRADRQENQLWQNAPWDEPSPGMPEGAVRVRGPIVGETAVVQVARYQKTIYEIVVSRLVDNFMVYVADVLAALLKLQPERMGSKAMVPLETVLQHDSIDELLAAESERKAMELGYKNVRDLSRILSDWGLELFESEEALAAAERHIDTRNLLVHNRGIVNGRWLQKHGSAYGVRGQRVGIPDAAVQALRDLHDCVAATDRRLIAKFEIPTVAAPAGLPPLLSPEPATPATAPALVVEPAPIEWGLRSQQVEDLADVLRATGYGVTVTRPIEQRGAPVDEAPTWAINSSAQLTGAALALILAAAVDRLKRGRKKPGVVVVYGPGRIELGRSEVPVDDA